MSIRKVVAGLLITAGIAIMAVPFFWRTTGEMKTNQLINQYEQTLEDDRNEETDVEEEQASISKEDEAILKEGGVIGIIEIPSIDIRYPVMEGTGKAVLNAGIGHIPETAGIGESGNCVLCGHNGSRYGTFFTPLNQISIGDDVTIIDKNGQGKEKIFVSMPSYKTKQVDEQGKAIYQDVCYPVTKEFREKLYNEIISEYEKAKDKSNEKARENAEKNHGNPDKDKDKDKDKEATPFR